MTVWPKAFFVTGTDTGVGKTVLSAILCLGLSGHYWKPIQAGGKSRKQEPADEASKTASQEISDSEWIRLAGVPEEKIFPARYHLRQPLSPHRAAELEGITISLSDFELPETDALKHLIVEGAGGVLVPLNEKDRISDLINRLKLPVVLAARSGLGTINHTLLSLEALRSRNIEILGVVMLGEKNQANRRAIENFGNVKILAQIPPLANFNCTTLQECFTSEFEGDESYHADAKQADLAPLHANAHSRGPS